MIDLLQILRSHGIKNKELLEEYLDHYSSMYEYCLDNGMNSSEAIILVEKEIKSLNATVITYEYLKLKYKTKIMSVLILCLMLFTASFLNQKMNEPPSISPVALTESNLTSSFGFRMHPVSKIKKMHNGIDIKAPLGTKVVAPSDGTVIDVGYDKLNGHFLEVKHDDEYSTRYHHLSRIVVQKDQKINKGDKIAEVGSSGLSTGPHLHYEVLKMNKHVDPSPFIKT